MHGPVSHVSAIEWYTAFMDVVYVMSACHTKSDFMLLSCPHASKTSLAGDLPRSMWPYEFIEFMVECWLC